MRERSKFKTPLDGEFLAFARQLRVNQTDAEAVLWGLLRNRRLGGFKFRRQHPLKPYVLDFFCMERKLAIELDGGQHNTEEGRAKDERRTQAIAIQGIRLVRYWCHEVLSDTESVLEDIWKILNTGAEQCDRRYDK